MRVIIGIFLILNFLNNFTPAWSCIFSSGSAHASVHASTGGEPPTLIDCPPEYEYTPDECRRIYDINECASTPCRNGGRCEDLFNEYHCICPRGFDGEICQNDTEIPRIICPSNQVIALITGTNTEAVYWDAPSVSDNSGNAQVQVADSRHQSGNLFPEGKTVVQYVATDQAGNTNTCSFIIHLDRAAKCDISPCQNGATCEKQFDDITCFCRRGYEGDRCEHDVEKPDIICPDEVFVETRSSLDGAIATWHEPIVSDNSGITHLTHLTPSHQSGDVFPIGSTTVTVSVADKSYNVNKCSFKVTVKHVIVLSLKDSSDDGPNTILTIGIPVALCFLILISVIAFFLIRRYRLQPTR